MSHVIINFAEHLTESITNAQNSLPFSVNFFHPANMFRNSKVKQRSAKQINEKKVLHYEKNISRNVIFKVLTCAIPDKMRD